MSCTIHWRLQWSCELRCGALCAVDMLPMMCVPPCSCIVDGVNGGRIGIRNVFQAAGGWIHNDRLQGVLAVSRAFGDVEHKILKEKCWEKTFNGDPLIAEPVRLAALGGLNGFFRQRASLL